MANATLLCPGNALRITTNRASRAVSGRQSRLSVTSLVNVRPYTVRLGDSMSSIADKRGFELKDVQHLNHGVDLDKLSAGQTILIPAGKLSSRDKEILEGISSKSYRLYPVRKDETIDDIMSKRGIVRSEMQELNPGINLDRIKEHQMLKLPANKYTTREKEMLAGIGVPQEFFDSKGYGIGFIAGIVAATCVAWVVRGKNKSEAEEEP